MLASSGDTVMTAAAGRRDTRMVEAGGFPVAGVMAGVALFAGLDMLWMFTGSNDAIMTTAAR